MTNLYILDAFGVVDFSALLNSFEDEWDVLIFAGIGLISVIVGVVVACYYEQE